MSGARAQVTASADTPSPPRDAMDTHKLPEHPHELVTREVAKATSTMSISEIVCRQNVSWHRDTTKNKGYMYGVQ